jgi:hypothetical protein
MCRLELGPLSSLLLALCKIIHFIIFEYGRDNFRIRIHAASVCLTGATTPIFFFFRFVLMLKISNVPVVICFSVFPSFGVSTGLLHEFIVYLFRV